MRARDAVKLILGFLGCFQIEGQSFGQCEGGWKPGEGVPGLDGEVYALSVHDDGSGSALYAGGQFRVAGSNLARNLAKWDGTKWNPIGPDFNGAVRALTSYRGRLIAGGNFTFIGSTFVNRIAEWDGAIWQPLQDGVYGNVEALAVHEGSLIVGGQFTYVSGPILSRKVARWDGVTWHSMNTPESSSYSVVRDITVYNGKLVVMGSFLWGNGMAGVAILEDTGWQALGSGLPAQSLSSEAVTVFKGELYAAGRRWTGATWEPVGVLDGINVYAYTEKDGYLFAGTTEGAYKWDGLALQFIGDSMRFYAATVFQDEVVFAGWFRSVKHNATIVGVSSIARWNGERWATLGTGMNNLVWALLPHENALFVAGSFRTAGEVQASHIARYSNGNWSSLVS